MRYCLLLILLLPSWAFAQQFTFTLEECIAKAQAESPAAKITRKSYEISHWNFQAFRAGLKPRIVLGGQLPNFDRSIVSNSQDNGSTSFVSRNQDYSSLDLAISQVIIPTGGTISLRSGIGRLDLFDTTGLSWNATPMLVTLNQPIFNYNPYKWDRKIQPIQYKVAEAKYLEGLEDIAVNITRNFFDMYIAEIQLENALFNVSVNDTVYKISRGRFNVGKIAENELLATELALLNAQSAAKNADLDLREAKEDLKISLGLPLEAHIRLTPATEIPQFLVDENFALEQAMNNRSDLLNFESRTISANSNLARAKYANRFNASLNASYGLNQSGSTLQEAYKDPLGQQSIGLGFSIPIYQFNRAKSEVKAATAARDQEMEQIRLDMRRLEKEVRYQALRFLLLQEQAGLSAKSDTIAQRQFTVATNRYLIGKISIIDLQTAQKQKDNARQGYISTLRGFWIAYYNLRRATLYDFARSQELKIINQLRK